ncbi:hypothetical protein [Streptomyces sp. XD-27]|uniref:AMIN-like domain-containing (lipo)protein n=1 Tax=Streptomyces sp. XD-27 TaxID=3062779 RepID=UPI0026F43A1C|nr:hypothetical protein [Streptomyces sp. XD-27]WKX71866.1 hypothetical protein Q3Y56_19950 [Streptomyces sp. XD-27]
MRRLGTTLAAITLAGAGVAGVAGTAGAATLGDGAAKGTVACATNWGKGEKSRTDAAGDSLTSIRTGKHDCFDRLVFDIKGGASGKIGYHVGYVKKFYQDGSGEEIPVKGGAILQIYVNAPSYDDGKETYPGRAGKPLPGVDIKGYKTFKDTKFGASFEGQTQVGVGVRAKLPFRVTQSGDRLIVDVAHAG